MPSYAQYVADSIESAMEDLHDGDEGFDGFHSVERIGRNDSQVILGFEHEDSGKHVRVTIEEMPETSVVHPLK